MKRRFNPKMNHDHAVSSKGSTKNSGNNGNVTRAVRHLIQARQLLSLDDPHINRIVFEIEDLEDECKAYLKEQAELADA